MPVDKLAERPKARSGKRKVRNHRDLKPEELCYLEKKIIESSQRTEERTTNRSHKMAPPGGGQAGR